FRNCLVREAVRMHNHCAGLLMNGVPYERGKLHRRHYFASLLEALREPTPGNDAGGGRAEDLADLLDPWGRLDHVPEEVRGLLAMSRASYEFFEQAQKKLLAGLATHPRIAGRVERLKTIPGVGDVTALSW